MTKQIFDLTNKVAIITGGTGVLGSAAALSLSTAGVKLALLTTKKSNGTKLESTISSNGGEVIVLEGNVQSQISMEEVKEIVLRKFGRVDILLNTAGGNMPGATIGPDQTIFDLNMDDFSKVTELNLNGTVIPSLVFGKVMADQGWGSIINYSSMAVPRVLTRVAGYSASKAAMENFTRWMAVEMATKFSNRIRVNAIAPGFFIGNQNRKLLLNADGTYTERGATIIKNTPMKRFGEPDELNGALHFLCSDASKFVTGAVIPIDGGFNIFSGV
ncbi:SDR family oxidoreductase [Flagellimonas pacifica]|uniref:NAD(P)-dependent dehydrogenase, short-chain alcohol dehydrogenase family n=1 Tax=Flagellimonas pacifica TaxID=1247520 RepID=A0A285MS68_9FLAO|nr:SDR family oxidoreductase [Allomuricauda parva]SNZ00049.1 NAD(P)-dependent dehydrogenase, short-chain alcohol dehydrogenase family [Allomuricauda parva]